MQPNLAAIHWLVVDKYLKPHVKVSLAEEEQSEYQKSLGHLDLQIKGNVIPFKSLEFSSKPKLQPLLVNPHFNADDILHCYNELIWQHDVFCLFKVKIQVFSVSSVKVLYVSCSVLSKLDAHGYIQLSFY